MPSFSARLTGFILRTTGFYRRMYSGGPGFEGRIAKIRGKRVAEPDGKARARLQVSSSDFQGRTVWRLAPKSDAPKATLLYWHGGGYVYPPSPIHWAFLARLAKEAGIEIIAPCYPLAPESDAIEITDFALSVYRDVSRKAAGPLLMGGDSAGGGLAAATAQMARDSGLALPKGLILICPWLNLVPDHEDQPKIEPRDGILTLSGIREAGALYARNTGTKDPRGSPIHGSFDGLPPIMAFGGGDDIIVTDARALKARLPSINYEEGPGLLHDWPIFTFPESRAAQAKMVGFINQQIA